MFLEKNLNALKKRYPEMAEALRNAPNTGRYRLMPSQRKDKIPTIVDLRLNKNYYNSFDPVMLAAQDILKRNINLPDLVVFLGFGAGYHVYEYLKMYPHAKVLVIERDLELLKLIFAERNFTDIINSSKVTFVAGIDINYMYPSIFNFFNNSTCLGLLQSINIIDIPASVAAHQAYYISAIRTIKDAVSGVLALYGNDPYDSLLGIKFTLRNIATIIDNPGVKDLEGVFKGKPGVVVATGPSLNKNVQLLEGIYNKAVIVGVDASAKVLKKNNLKPAHLVTSLERVIETSRLFEGLTPDDVKDSYLAACPVIVPETYANFPGEKIIIYRNFATFKWLDVPKGILDIGPSSANMAFKLLEFLGCDPIIIIGQDLAYGPDFQSHADGFHYGTAADKGYQQGTLQIPGNYAETVHTTPTWFQFLKHYERDLATYKGTAINATEGGAKIVGTQVMTFAEAIEKYIDKDINVIETIKKNLKIPAKKIKINQEREVLKKLYHARDYCTSVQERYEKGTALCLKFDEIYSACGMTPDDNQAAQLNNLVQEALALQSISGEQDFYLILMHYVQSFYIKAAMDLNGIRFANPPSFELNVKMVEKIKEMYSVLGILTQKLNDEFKISIELLEEYRNKIEVENTAK